MVAMERKLQSKREAIQTINFEVSNTKKGGIGRCRHRWVPGTRCLLSTQTWFFSWLVYEKQ
jgi:hypothetical protein